MQKINEKVELLCVSLMIVLLFLLFLGVIFRYILNSPIIWQYELSIILFIWMIFLSASVAMWKLEHLKLSFLVGLLPEKSRKILEIIALIGIILMSFIAMKEGFKLVESSLIRKFRTVPISIGWLYGAVPTSFILIMLDTFLKLIEKFSLLLNNRDKSIQHDKLIKD